MHNQSETDHLVTDHVSKANITVNKNVLSVLLNKLINWEDIHLLPSTVPHFTLNTTWTITLSLNLNLVLNLTLKGKVMVGGVMVSN